MEISTPVQVTLNEEELEIYVTSFRLTMPVKGIEYPRRMEEAVRAVEAALGHKVVVKITKDGPGDALAQAMRVAFSDEPRVEVIEESPRGVLG